MKRSINNHEYFKWFLQVFVCNYIYSRTLKRAEKNSELNKENIKTFLISVFCFHIQSVSLWLFVDELSPFIIRDINDRWLLVPVILVFVVGNAMWVFFSFFGICYYDIISFLFLLLLLLMMMMMMMMMYPTSLGWSFPSSSLCRAGFEARY